MKGRFNINTRKPKLWMLVRTKQGAIERREVIQKKSSPALYNSYVKDFQSGLYLKYGTLSERKIKDRLKRES